MKQVQGRGRVQEELYSASFLLPAHERWAPCSRANAGSLVVKAERIGYNKNEYCSCNRQKTERMIQWLKFAAEAMKMQWLPNGEALNG